MIDLTELGNQSFLNNGCTANVSVIDHTQKMLYVANIGDARCLVATKDSQDFK